MSTPWTRERLQSYIENQIQEDLNLDYKGAGSLAKSDGKKKEIHKDVSAMANSAGGTVVYGIREFDDADRRHLPERFDPIDQTAFPREWLEQVINGIQPRIQDLVITAVPLSTGENDVAYVVEIPRSNTAHQAVDKRYYKRFNYVSEPMEDYEVRDVMNRSAHALIDLEFELEFETRTVHEEKYITHNSVFDSHLNPKKWHKSTEHHAILYVFAQNSGAVYAQYVMGYLTISKTLLEDADFGEKADDEYIRLRVDNNQDAASGLRRWQVAGVPVLPGTREKLETVEFEWNYAQGGPNHELLWEVYADNARVRRGVINMNDLRANSKETSTTWRKGVHDLNYH